MQELETNVLEILAYQLEEYQGETVFIEREASIKHGPITTATLIKEGCLGKTISPFIKTSGDYFSIWVSYPYIFIPPNGKSMFMYLQYMGPSYPFSMRASDLISGVLKTTVGNRAAQERAVGDDYYGKYFREYDKYFTVHKSFGSP